MARRPPGVSRSARWLGAATVAVIAVVAIFLAVAAIERVSAAPDSGAAEPVPSFSFGASAAPTTSPTPTETAPQTPTAPAADQRFLSVSSGGWWRATAGACNGPAPVIERSTDAGRTWTDVTPTYRGIAQVISLSSFAGTEAEMIAAIGPDCEVLAMRTFTQGEFWDSYPDVLESSAYPDPADPATFIAPSGSREAPCADPRSVRTAGQTAALICDGAALVSTGDEWRPLGSTGSSALAASNDTVFVAGTVENCDGVGITRYPLPEGDPEPLGCATDVDASAPLAIAQDGNATLVWSADAITRVTP